ncbi:maturation of 16S RNA and assembly of 30S ribosomal subunit GTPase [Candidatus Hydrogenisulfobacillus filiaventi]|uniref:GTPase Era n=1 Tax=Candidatus Hydrogenisulfobacillus filiaventi TaxID=2707344 RepID=A0A6F8ZIJ6_9FIRM|nr:maturation of 16S RNA and assembly of 30S ribosomal subunit GTPase [Candidatus Hydrogenisulfobacillus filiaventi]
MAGTPETAEGFRSGFVALAGRPNVGKSTLLNALVGSKVAIVAPKAQTTRNAIRGILHRPGLQAALVDTPGIHRPLHKLGERMVAQAERALREADLVWHVADLTRDPNEEDQRVAALLARQATPAWLVANKADALEPARLAAREQAYAGLMAYRRRFTVSALTGAGLDALLAALAEALPPGPPFFPEDMVTDQAEDFYVAEVIREKVLLAVREEVPHAVAVTVEEKTAKGPDLTYIRAAIYVEREGQKAILIGEGGRMLKSIGQAARLDLEAYFGHRVYLDLWVKVRKHWRNEAGWLRRFGYGEE